MGKQIREVSATSHVVKKGYKKVRWKPEVATVRAKTLNFTRVIHFNWSAKIELREPGPLVVNIIVNYCCTRILFYTKRDEKTETEETIGFFYHVFINGGILIWGGDGPLFGYAYGVVPLNYAIVLIF